MIEPPIKGRLVKPKTYRVTMVLNIGLGNIAVADFLVIAIGSAASEHRIFYTCKSELLLYPR